jgi:hypothetical protein
MENELAAYVSLASYLPDSQLITLGPEFAAWTDQSNPDRERALPPQRFATFFHEWIHYLHNVSTIHGLSAFANLVHLWTEFRSTIGSDGLSRGGTSLSAEAQSRVRQKLVLLGGLRRSKRNVVPANVTESQLSIESTHTRWDPIPEHDARTWTIVCVARRRVEEGDPTGYRLEIGAHEILESVAFMLEGSLAKLLNTMVEDAPIAPYCLLRLLAAHVSPALDDREVLICGLASLQGTSPAEGLVAILRLAQERKSAGEDVLHFLEEAQAADLIAGKETAESWLKEVEAVFPLNEPMGHAVKETTQTIRRNLEKRRRSPFFELSLIELIAKNGAAMDEILKEFGACGILQKQPGFEEDIERDRIYEFAVSRGADMELSHGRRIMHFAFRFLYLHFFGDGTLRATSTIPVGSGSRCPAYTACTLAPRIGTPEICAEEPWLNTKTENIGSCWYADAVCRVAPREIAGPLYWGDA